MSQNTGHWADKAFWWVAPIVLVASAAGGLYYYYRVRHKDVPASSAALPEAAPVERAAAPAIKHPLPQAASGSQAQPLPALNDSDAALARELGKAFGGETVTRMLVPDGLVRRIVVTVDNIPRAKVAVEKRPVKSLEGATPVATEGDLITLSEANYARYTPMVRLLSSMDMQKFADLYFRWYPLFQQAYEDLGYPGQYFNDRLVEAIDSVLAAPDPAGRIQLVQPRVFYEFADPKLEERPAGQKLMIRMGRENAASVKAQLRELRRIVTTGRDPPSGSESSRGEVKPPRSGIISPPLGMHHWL